MIPDSACILEVVFGVVEVVVDEAMLVVVTTEKNKQQLILIVLYLTRTHKFNKTM